MRTIAIFAVLLCAFASAGTLASDKGYFGLSVSVDADGFINPTLKTVIVKGVTPNSPAAKAGVVAGDAIPEVEGKTISGLKAADLKPFMQRKVGETTSFDFKRASGELKSLSLVAAPKAD